MSFKLKLKKNHSFLVAEIGWNFLGNISLAKKLILSAKQNGADAVKFQIWNPENLKKGPWDKDGRRELYKKSYLDKKKYTELFNYSKKNKILCFASVWSISDMELLKSVSNQVVKIPSPEAYNIKLIRACLKNFKKVIISCGCLNMRELKNIVNLKNKNKIIALHCVSSYPLNPKECNFQKFYYLKRKFKDVGYSGHLEGINDAVFAMANNACLIEKHYTINKNLPGRDNKFSLTPEEFKSMKNIRDNFEDFNFKRGLNIQKSEIEIKKHYRGRWIKSF